MTSEENEIIDGCIKHKPLSQRALYDKYSAKMFAVCLRYARNRADAEDIFQEAFVKVYNVIEKFNFIGSFEGWIRRVFVNYALNYYRSSKEFISLDEHEFNHTYEHVNFSRFTLNEILTSVNTLTDNYRLVFNLVEIEGYSYDEVSILLNMPNSTVRVLNHRAKEKLKQQLTDKENFEL